MLSLAALHLYPVKSCRGITVPEATVTDAGLEHDREWMVVTPEGRFVTQRECPRLATVRVSLNSGALTLSFAQCVEKARLGASDDDHVLLRVFLALAGLWSAGVVGFMGLSLPPFGFFAVLGVTSAFLAVMGHEWTADLLKPGERAA